MNFNGEILKQKDILLSNRSLIKNNENYNLEIEIKERNVKKIYKNEITNKNDDDSSKEYTYSVVLKTLDDEILISGNIETIDIPDYIDIIQDNDSFFII